METSLLFHLFHVSVFLTCSDFTKLVLINNNKNLIPVKLLKSEESSYRTTKVDRLQSSFVRQNRQLKQMLRMYFIQFVDRD